MVHRATQFLPAWLFVVAYVINVNEEICSYACLHSHAAGNCFIMENLQRRISLLACYAFLSAVVAQGLRMEFFFSITSSFHVMASHDSKVGALKQNFCPWPGNLPSKPLSIYYIQLDSEAQRPRGHKQKKSINIYAKSHGLSGSLLDTGQISHSPVQVTKSPGRQPVGREKSA